MQPGAGFTGVYLGDFAIGVGRADDAQCGAVAASRQCACVAVGINAAAFFNQRSAKLPHSQISGDVFFVNPLRFGDQCVWIFGTQAGHALKCPEQVNGGWAGFCQYFISFAKIAAV